MFALKCTAHVYIVHVHMYYLLKINSVPYICVINIHVKQCVKNDFVGTLHTPRNSNKMKLWLHVLQLYKEPMAHQGTCQFGSTVPVVIVGAKL